MSPFVSSRRGGGAGGAAPSPYREATFDNAGGPAKTDWPVKISLTSSNFDFSQITDGTEFRFTADDGTTALSYWREAVDVGAETATLWVKVPSIGAGGEATVRLYWDSSSDLSDGPAVFPLLFEDFEDVGALTTTIDASLTLGNYRRYPNPIIERDASPSWKAGRLHEVGNVVYDPDDPDPSRRYKLYFSARDESLQIPGSVGVAFSPSLEPGAMAWTEYAENPVIVNREDPHVVRVGPGDWHMWVETGDPGSGGIDHYTSADGLAWTADPANPVMSPSGVADTWDENKVGSPCVYYDAAANGGAGRFYMIYDGRDTSALTQDVGVARSDDGSTWTPEPTNPVFRGSAAPLGSAEIVPSDVGRTPTGWYVLMHGGGDDPAVLRTADGPEAWDDASWALADDGTGAEFDAHLDATMLPRSDDPASGLASGVMVTENDAGSRVWLVDVLGGAGRTFYRLGDDATHPDAFIEVHEGEMLLEPRPAPANKHSLAFVLDAALTAGFAVRARMRKAAAPGATRDMYAAFGVGAGALVAAGGNDHEAVLDDGYWLYLHDEGGNSTGLRRVSSGTVTTVGSNQVVTGYDDWHDYELRYLASGALSWARDGTEMASGTDTAHAAAEKAVWVRQGHNDPTFRGAVSRWAYVLARPYDGTDPAVTVGEETTA